MIEWLNQTTVLNQLNSIHQFNESWAAAHNPPIQFIELEWINVWIELMKATVAQAIELHDWMKFIQFH